MKDLKAQIEREMASKLKSYGREDDAKDRKMMQQSHESRMHGVKHRAAGGAIEGGMAKPRMDRAGGGKKKGKGSKGTTVNVVIAGKGGDDKPPMMPQMPPAAMAPPMPPKPPMPMPPPGAGPGGPGGPMPPPGAGPGGPPMPMRAAGGRVPHMTAGAGSGEGRLEKIKDVKAEK